MARIAVFAYGSLVDPGSAALTLGREVDRVWPARLPGWRRRFSQARDNRECEKTFASTEDGSVPPHVLGLNIEPSAVGAAPNGALIEVSGREVERLDRRELRYERVEVGGSVSPAADAPEFDLVVAYVAKRAHHAPAPPPGAVILRHYATTVEAAFAALGPGQRDEYLRTTLPYPTRLIDGRLIDDRIPAGNPRGW